MTKQSENKPTNVVDLCRIFCILKFTMSSCKRTQTLHSTQTLTSSFFVLSQIYPDEGHFIHSEATRQHLSQSLVNFFEECFRLPERVFEETLEEEIEDEG